MNLDLITLIISLLGGGSSLFFEIAVRYIKKKKQDTTVDIANQIKKVSTSLADSSAELGEIQLLLEKRIRLVNDLQAQAETAERLMQLSKEQVDAVKSALGNELKREGRKSFWQGVLVNFIFFVLGAVASYFMSNYFG